MKHVFDIYTLVKLAESFDRGMEEGVGLPRHHGRSNTEDDRFSEGGFECQGRHHSIRQSSSEKPSD